MINMLVEYIIALQPYCIEVIFGFKKAVYVGISKCRITTKIPDDGFVSITLDHRLENTLPVVGTIDIAVFVNRRCGLYVPAREPMP